MQSKVEITSSCRNKINSKRSELVRYKNYIESKINVLDQYSTGNRGIEEIEEELISMKKIIGKLIDSCDNYKIEINNNEGRFQEE